MEALSSNQFSVDIQIEDAMDWLRINHEQVYLDLLVKFPEWENREGLGGTGCWFDYEAMGVDPEWSSWLADAIEDTGLVWWEEGEPWAGDRLTLCDECGGEFEFGAGDVSTHILDGQIDHDADEDHVPYNAEVG